MTDLKLLEDNFSSAGLRALYFYLDGTFDKDTCNDFKEMTIEEALNHYGYKTEEELSSKIFTLSVDNKNIIIGVYT